MQHASNAPDPKSSMNLHRQANAKDCCWLVHFLNKYDIINLWRIMWKQSEIVSISSLVHSKIATQGLLQPESINPNSKPKVTAPQSGVGS